MTKLAPHLAFIGYSNSGKTTVVSQVVTQLKQKGCRIGVLKHDAHDFQMDTEGKDTFKYRQAGADIVAIASPTQLNILERREESPFKLEEILTRFNGVDLIIIEGYKQENIPKILVARTIEQLALRGEVQGIIAIATTLPADALGRDNFNRGLPILDLNNILHISDFVEQWYRSQENK
jgi:molybdopterin-guanine dinucleotide biosynthesis protein B